MDSYCYMKNKSIYTFVVNCPVGTFLKTTQYAGGKTCAPCPVGQYNDKEGQSLCKQCETGKTTSKEGSSNADHCYSMS